MPTLHLPKKPANSEAPDDCLGLENDSVDAREQNCASQAQNEKAPERASDHANLNTGEGGDRIGRAIQQGELAVSDLAEPTAAPAPKSTEHVPESEEAEHETEAMAKEGQERPWDAR